ncbi:MAG: riboflavin biosynthesis protein RibF [Marinilabiliaceae bacterium]
MEVFSDIDSYPVCPAAVCVGVFDGVHLGHRALLSELVSEARSRGLASVVVTFDPHPREVLSKGNDRVGILSTADERVGLIGSSGVDRLVVVPFTREFSDLTARQFIGGWLRDKVGARFLLMGYNHRFGSDDVEPADYVPLAASEGVEARRGGAFTLPGGVKVSSSEVRKALADGLADKAALLLGREYSFQGTVVHGDALGRSLGAPTANIQPDDGRKMLPADGVYSGLVKLPGRQPLRAVINVGTRPTVGGSDRRVEAHIIGFEGDIYGQRAEVSIHARLRGERKFDDVESLAGQIREDVRNAISSFDK